MNCLPILENIIKSRKFIVEDNKMKIYRFAPASLIQAYYIKEITRGKLKSSYLTVTQVQNLMLHLVLLDKVDFKLKGNLNVYGFKNLPLFRVEGDFLVKNV
jgi:hypothetical protein